jgi:hypothetical protein
MQLGSALYGRDGRPTERELLDEVARHTDGIDALSLAKLFEAKGYEPYNVQRAMQRALDTGVLELGTKLRLYARRVAA